MNNQKGFTAFEVLIAIVILFCLMAWIKNVFKFASCDFESNYKCEVIHGVGVFIPPAALITVWFDHEMKG